MPLKELLTILPWKNSRLKRVRKKGNDEEKEEHLQLNEDEQQKTQVVPPSPTLKGEFQHEEQDMLDNFIDAELGTATVCLSRTFQQIKSRRAVQTHPLAQVFMRCLDQGNMLEFKKVIDDLGKEELGKVRIAGQPLLHLICLKEDIEALHLVLDTGTEVNPESDDGTIPLHIAVHVGWVEGVRELLRYGADKRRPPVIIIPSFGVQREAPILTAARNGDYETACLLMGDENKTEYKNTPIVLLDEIKEDVEDDSEKEASKTVEDKELLDKIHDHLWTVKDFWGNTVVHLAALSHCAPLLQRLMSVPELKEIVNDKNKGDGDSPLHLLIRGPDAKYYQEECVECIQILVKSGADVNLKNKEHGRTPLHLAAQIDLPKVVYKLLEFGADPRVENKNGRSAVHAACRGASHESLLLLVRSGISVDLITKEDSKGLSPFHLAVSSVSVECCQILLENGEHLATKDSEKNSRCMIAFKKMPSATYLMKKVLDSKISVSDHDRYNRDYNVEIDFDIILSKDDAVQNSIISDLTHSDLEPLLTHPVLDSFLNLKWHKIRFFFYSYVLLYFIFLIVHTIYIVKTFGMIGVLATEWTEYQIRNLHAIYTIMLSVLLFPGTVIILANFWKYLKQWETWFKLVALATACYVVFSHDITIAKTEAERLVACVSIFFAWVEFTMLLGRFPHLGIYILMFTRVSKSVIKIVAAFMSLIIAFVLVFCMLYSNIAVFSTFPISLVKTLMMMLGEIDYGDIYEQSTSPEPGAVEQNGLATIIVGQLFLVAFLFLIPILMANLLIGVAVNNLPDIERHSKIRMLVKKAAYLVAYERILEAMKATRCFPNFIVRKLYEFGKVKRKIVNYPNKIKSASTSLILFFLPKRIKDEDKIENTTIPSDAFEEAVKIGQKIEKKDENLYLQELVQHLVASQVQTQNQLDAILQAVSKDKTNTDIFSVARKKFGRIRMPPLDRRSRLDLFKSVDFGPSLRRTC